MRQSTAFNRIGLVEQVRAVDPFFAQTIEEHPFESTFEEVPFWRKTRIRTITAKTFFRTVTRRYADDGERISAIASPDAIYAINAREGMELDDDTLAAYVRFFMQHAGVGRGIRLLEDRPIRARGETAIAAAIRGDDHLEVTIKVARNGVVEALTTVVVLP
jgi:hypothetical protein